MYEQINKHVRLNQMENEMQEQYKILFSKARDRAIDPTKMEGRRVRKVSSVGSGFVIYYDDSRYTYFRVNSADGYTCVESEYLDVEDAIKLGILKKEEITLYRAAEDAYYNATQRQRDIENFIKLAKKLGPEAKELL